MDPSGRRLGITRLWSSGNNLILAESHPLVRLSLVSSLVGPFRLVRYSHITRLWSSDDTTCWSLVHRLDSPSTLVECRVLPGFVPPAITLTSWSLTHWFDSPSSSSLDLVGSASGSLISSGFGPLMIRLVGVSSADSTLSHRWLLGITRLWSSGNNLTIVGWVLPGFGPLVITLSSWGFLISPGFGSLMI